MAKKKAKKPLHLSLADRLTRHWSAGQWEALVTLYLRDRTASERTAWADRFGDALFNALTRALFLSRDFAAAADLAELLAGEAVARPSLPAAPLWADCARLAQNFLARRKNARSPLAPLADPAALPEPWSRLNALLTAWTPPPAPRGRKKKAAPQSEAEALVHKLANQFAALAGAKNSRPFTAFAETAAALEQTARGTPSAPVFTAVRAVADLLRRLGGPRQAGDETLRSPADLARSRTLAKAIPGGSHPAVLTLWDFFREQGRAKFGEDWGRAAGVLRARLAPDRHPELAGVLGPLLSPRPAGAVRPGRSDLPRDESPPPSVCFEAARLNYGRWSEPELYLLIAALAATVTRDGPDVMEALEAARPDGGPPAWWASLTALGTRWRPRDPWPRAAHRLLATLILSRGPDYILTLDRRNLPWAALEPVLLILTGLVRPTLLPDLAALGQNPPWPLKGADFEYLAEFLMRTKLEPTDFERLRSLVVPANFPGLLEFWVERAVEASALAAAEGHLENMAWKRLAALLDLLAQHLPPDSPARAWVELNRNQPARRPDRDPAKVQVLTAALSRTARPNYGFGGDLFILTAGWPEADPELLAELFRPARPHFDHEERWRTAAEAVAAIKDPTRRRDLARTLAAQLTPLKISPKGVGKTRRSPGRLRDSDQGRNLGSGQNPSPARDWTPDHSPDAAEARRWFEALARGQKLPPDLFDNEFFTDFADLFHNYQNRRSRKTPEK